MPKNKFSGFTLIELLVVISIIGILSSIVLVSLNQARIKARNSARNSQIAEYGKALILSMDSNNGRLPGTPGTGIASTPTYQTTYTLGNYSDCSQPDTVFDDAIKIYLPSLPSIPCPAPIMAGHRSCFFGANYYRRADSDAINAQLLWMLEKTQGNNICIAPPGSVGLTEIPVNYNGRSLKLCTASYVNGK